MMMESNHPAFGNSHPAMHPRPDGPPMPQFPLGIPPPPGVASPPMSMAALMANGGHETLAAAATAAAVQEVGEFVNLILEVSD